MTIKNLAASVHARLAERARKVGRPFQELLEYFAMERFLYRLSTSPHADRFVLKGALMLRVWEAPAARPTRDIDLLGRMDNSPENLARVVAEVCDADVEPDGLVFKANTVKAIRIKEDADYAGVRVRFQGLLGNRIRGVGVQGERASDREALATKGRRRRSGDRAAMATALTWGDLGSCLKGRRR